MVSQINAFPFLFKAGLHNHYFKAKVLIISGKAECKSINLCKCKPVFEYIIQTQVKRESDSSLSEGFHAKSFQYPENFFFVADPDSSFYQCQRYIHLTFDQLFQNRRLDLYCDISFIFFALPNTDH